MTYEDFTTYTEVDPNLHLDKTAYHVDHKGYTNEDCYLYKDYGVDHFGDFTHLIDVKPVAKGATNYGNSIYTLSVDTVDDFYGLETANKTSIGMTVANYATWPYYTKLFETYAGTLYATTHIKFAEGTWYYLKLVKSGTSLTLYVYSDAARTTQVAGSPLSLTLHADHKFRYLFACNTYNNATNTNKWCQVYWDNLDLQEGAPPAGQPYVSRVQQVSGMHSWIR